MPLSEIACTIHSPASLYSRSDVEVGFRPSAAPATSSYVSATVFPSLSLFLGVYEYQGLCARDDITYGFTNFMSCSITALIWSLDP